MERNSEQEVSTVDRDGNPYGARLKRARELAGKSPREIAPLVETEYWATMLPISKMFAPARVMTREMGAPGWTALSRSAQRPPQPVVGGWSGTEVCHWVCWSA